MEFIRLKEILKYLYIKKNNLIFEKEDIELLNEIEFLMTLYSSLYNVNVTECSCVINSKTLQQEIDKNQCKKCGLPLVVS